ncbi:MJ0042-type zinc finger domain-containing protein [Croceicoccus marinus]|jgi:predicted Zn finger-like uncharacterized protein|uniref:Zinc-ribbon domain-containing protein n=1 Tax=Croceicoccus marinus TaxID=450378 RepID=A0A7G6VVZ5_9SPHN|nr:MJ0042-type zinc finger domain-containing protein [Croceicoccus marinus]QNE05910.1 zinc-ribbon domain-containing protein [Croceicoccus marinus]
MQIACPACHTRYAVPETAIGAYGRTVRCAKCRHSWYQPGTEDVAEDAVTAESVSAPAAASAMEPMRETAQASREPVTEGAQAGWRDPPPAPRGWADMGDTQTVEPETEAEVRAETQAETGTARTGWVASPGDRLVEPEADHAGPDVPEPEVEEEPAPRAAGPAFTAAAAEPVDAEFEDLDEGDRPRSRWKRLLLICALLVVLAAALVYGAVRYFGAPAWLPVGQSTFAPASESLVLDFPANEQDRRELPNGRQLFAASGTITNTGNRTEHVPPVLVVLRDSQERIVYSWEMEPSRSELGPGESVKVSQMVTDVPRSARIVDIGWKPG